MKRRECLKMAGALVALGLPLLARAAQGPLVQVYKNEGCGCCEGWIAHLEKNGFRVKWENVADTSVYRRKLGIPQELGSCHTAVVEGYALEGHVPAAEVLRLLKERPKAVGLAVPGMPVGSPGMEGDRQDKYDVLLVLADGRKKVFRKYVGASPARL